MLEWVFTTLGAFTLAIALVVGSFLVAFVISVLFIEFEKWVVK